MIAANNPEGFSAAQPLRDEFGLPIPKKSGKKPTVNPFVDKMKDKVESVNGENLSSKADVREADDVFVELPKTDDSVLGSSVKRDSVETLCDFPPLPKMSGISAKNMTDACPVTQRIWVRKQPITPHVPPQEPPSSSIPGVIEVNSVKLVSSPLKEPPASRPPSGFEEEHPWQEVPKKHRIETKQQPSASGIASAACLEESPLNGNVCNSHPDIAHEAVDYFTELFGTSKPVQELPEELILPQLSLPQKEFLSLPFTASDVLKAVKIIMGSSFSLAGDWASYQNGLFTTNGERSPVKKHLAHLYLAVCVYYIWKERNDRIHTSGHALSPATLRLIINRTIREKLSTNSFFKKAVAKDFSLVLALY
ncbi:hypothetical protein ACET3Z_013191 [Daucus carota]